MAVNLDKPNLWKKDVASSVDMYNDWFMQFAPEAFRTTRIETTRFVEKALVATDNLRNIEPADFRRSLDILPTLRMSTCPPIAVDRLIGLAGVKRSVVENLEGRNPEGIKRLPPKMAAAEVDKELAKVSAVIRQMADPDIFVWLERPDPPTEQEIHRASTIVADRLCGAVANPIIRNAQEKRQLAIIKEWLENRGYRQADVGIRFDAMKPKTFSFRTNVPATLEDGKQINIPIDCAIKADDGKPLPLFFEAKSAGDFTNTNKRRKEEAVKMSQLKATYGPEVRFNLFLCGYFDTPYLGYEAAEGIDWVWEHRLDDFTSFGL